MPLKLTAPIYKTMTLDRSDERYGNDGKPTEIVVRQASQVEHERRQQVFNTLERKYSDLQPEEVTVIQNIPMEELKRLETWLTMCSCDIVSPEGEALFPSVKGNNGHPQLKMTKAEFDIAWGSLLPDIAEEIHEKVLAVNIIWQGKRGEAS